jgi:hypothetical protein
MSLELYPGYFQQYFSVISESLSALHLVTFSVYFQCKNLIVFFTFVKVNDPFLHYVASNR